MPTGNLSFIVMDELPYLSLKVAEDRTRLIDAGTEVKNGMLLELLLVLVTTVITDGLVFSQTEPIGLSVVLFVLHCRVIGAGINDQV